MVGWGQLGACRGNAGRLAGFLLHPPDMDAAALGGALLFPSFFPTCGEGGQKKHDGVIILERMFFFNGNSIRK
jgi:hypothetical protein